MTRKESREAAFEILFEASFRKEEPLEDIIAQAEESRGLALDEFAGELISKAFHHIADLDKLIEKHSKNWKKHRISRVNLAILRIAITEIEFFDDTPLSVAINEAVEIAKKYGGEGEYAFVNGVLGGLAREKEQNPPTEGETQPENNF